ncbi:unnamed protein product [Cylicocyclus nassatus]|uniref:CUB domain-containing protein n=1 Tax=Cylicocyclus nassatus TaxID=53992 RepID=A0AA36DR63_CYLNA|nr:unnamed protein product [Cylicocyclus nassatus]
MFELDCRQTAKPDNTSFDYNNIGHKVANRLHPRGRLSLTVTERSDTVATGNCIALSPVSELVPRGKWISVSCTSPLPFICKREADCSKPTTPTPVTLAPSTCDAPYYFTEQNRTFYSPGFPNSYRSCKACYYILTVEQKIVGKFQKVVQIHFDYLQLSQGSSIKLFYSISDSTPFMNITTNVSSSLYFNSASNVMKVIFVTGSDGDGINKWKASFSPYDKVITTSPMVTIMQSPTNPSGCNQNSVVAINILTLLTPTMTTLISVFRFSGQIAAGNKTFTSTFNEMIVDFNSDSIGEKGGFSAVAIAVV